MVYGVFRPAALRVKKVGGAGRLQFFDRQLQIVHRGDYGCSTFELCPLIFPKWGFSAPNLAFFWTEIFLTIFWQPKIRGGPPPPPCDEATDLHCRNCFVTLWVSVCPIFSKVIFIWSTVEQIFTDNCSTNSKKSSEKCKCQISQQLSLRILNVKRSQLFLIMYRIYYHVLSPCICLGFCWWSVATFGAVFFL